MTPIKIDFTDTDDGQDFEPLPIGTYDAVVFDAEVRTGRTSGKPYINWQFKITGPAYENRRAWFTSSLQPQSLWNLKKVLVNLGIDPETMSEEFDLELNDLLGKTCQIIIGHEEYNGKMSDKVVDVLPPGEGADDLPF